MLSIILPSYKEPFLQKTIDDIKEHAETGVEIIAVLDGYRAPVTGAHVLELGRNVGMRDAINMGVKLSRGSHILKADAHCSFAQGFDHILLDHIKENEVVIPRRYRLEPDTWTVSEDYVDFEKLIIHKTRGKFHGEPWIKRTKENKEPVDETMMFQGSCWMVHRSWWDTIGELDSKNYGPFVQEPVEIAMKTWQAGGKLMLNKLTWYAHKDRKFSRTHNVTPEEQNYGNDYALEKWGEYYESVIKPRFEIQ